MEYDGLFVGTKWDVLTILSSGPSSPYELAKKLQTSLANVSQQIRFLEFAGIVERNKIQTNKIGKPTTQLVIKNDFSYCVSVKSGQCKKSLFQLDFFQKLMFLAWENFSGSEREYFEEFIYQNRKLLENITKIGIKDRLSTNLYVFLDNTPNTKRLKVGSLDFIFFQDDAKQDSTLNYIYLR
ncbi:MarR family transcriptional regulator [Candidatus Woesearchaeota archaeon]|nr:MarR family transcriptional regulator [Candidatus Woesearchaeota archaeon]